MNDPAAHPADIVPPIRGIRRNIAILLGSQVTTWLLSAVLIIMVPRLLDPVSIGQLGIAQSLWAIVAVFIAFGMPTYQTVTVARHREQARPLQAAVAWMRTALLLVSLPVVAAISLVAGYESMVLILIGIYTLFTLFNAIGSTAHASLFGLEAMGSAARVDVTSEVLRSVVVLAALAMIRGPITFAIATSSASLVAMLLSRWELFRITKPVDIEPLRRGLALLRASRSFFFANAMAVVYLQIDTIVISLLATEAEVGWYVTADALFSSLLFVPAVLVAAVFPRMARAHHERSEALAAQFHQVFSTVLVFGVWIGLGTLIVSDSLVSSLFGPEYDGAGPVLASFGVVAILAYLSILLGQFAAATDRARYIGYLLLIASIASIPLDIVLVRWTHDRYDNGAIGAALAFVVTEALQVGLGIALLAPHLASRRTAGRLIRCAVAGAAMVAATWPLRTRSLLVTVPLASVVYLGVLALLRTPDEFEREALHGLWRRVRERLPRRPRRPSAPVV